MDKKRRTSGKDNLKKGPKWGTKCWPQGYDEGFVKTVWKDDKIPGSSKKGEIQNKKPGSAAVVGRSRDRDGESRKGDWSGGARDLAILSDQTV